jgi:hypothetical protein
VDVVGPPPRNLFRVVIDVQDLPYGMSRRHNSRNVVSGWSRLRGRDGLTSQSYGLSGLRKINAKSPNAFLIVSLGACGLCLYFLLDGYSRHSNDVDTWWVMVLLALPLLLQMLGLLFLYRKASNDSSIWNFYWYYMIGMILLFIAAYAIMWKNYEPDGHNSSLDQSVPLAAIVILLVLVAGATYSLMQPSNGIGNEMTNRRRRWHLCWNKVKRIWGHCILLRDMKDCVSKVPFWALLYFFSVYLVINAFFGFAFAAHYDKFKTNDGNIVPPLYRSRLFASEKQKRELQDRYDQTPKNNSGNTSDIGKSNDSIAEPFEFFFDSDNPFMIHEAAHTSDKRGNDIWNWKRAKNEEHARSLVDVIDEATKGSRRVVVQLRGHADDKNPSPSRFPSNQALSEARTSAVLIEILKGLKQREDRWRDIQWFPFGIVKRNSS